MTTTTIPKPKALQFADRQEMCATAWIEGSEPHQFRIDTAAELRRQHAEIARLTAENEALKAAVSEAVAEERMACAELMEQQHTWITNVAASALIRARGTP